MSGLVFPLGDDGQRSTSVTGKAVWADAVRDVDTQLAERIEATRDWRKGYVQRVVEVTTTATRSPERAVGVARAGLASLAQRMRFESGGASLPVAEAVTRYDGPVLGTEVVAGAGQLVRQLVVPYRGRLLSGDLLRQQLQAWVAAGLVERSFAAAVTAVIDRPEWLDLSDRAFAVLGAGAELGPTLPLLSWGAHVAAVDLPEARMWRRLREAAASSAGVLHVPGGSGAPDGADLLEQTPQVARWLVSAAEGRPLTVGSYAYADGAKHVLVAMAGDAVVEHLLNARRGTSYAELATPTDAYAVPMDLVEDSRGTWSDRGGRRLLQAPARVLGRGSLYAPAYAVTVRRDDGTEVGIADALVPQQGPNYTLAKRLQRWRAVVAQADGLLVSANVAPATSTRSVTKNRLLAAAYAGASSFGVEVFAPEAARVLMAAVLVNDLRSERSAPAHPDDLFVDQSAHGGLWRIGYSPRSVLGIAAVRGLPSTLRRR